jgi:hypothetical protein
LGFAMILPCGASRKGAGYFEQSIFNIRKNSVAANLWLGLA